MRVLIHMSKKEAFHAPALFYAHLKRAKMDINSLEFSEIMIHNFLRKPNGSITYIDNKYQVDYD